MLFYSVELQDSAAKKRQFFKIPEKKSGKKSEAGASGDDSVQCDTTFNRFTTFFLPGLGEMSARYFSTIFQNCRHEIWSNVFSIFIIRIHSLINISKAVCLWLTSCCRIAMVNAFRVPTKTAKVFALVNPV